MQHTEAEQTMAVERYLLGDMNAGGVAEFEEHLFTCPQCAESVRSGAIFVDNSRAVFRESAAVEKAAARQRAESKTVPWWRGFLTVSFAPALVALVLLCVAAYQRFVVIPGLRTQLAEVTAPQGLASFPLHAVVRGSPQSIVIPADARFFSLYFDVAVPSTSGYSCAILDATGAVRFTQHMAPPAPEAAGTLNLLLGSSALPAGDYTLVVNIEAPHKQEIDRYPFTIRHP